MTGHTKYRYLLLLPLLIPLVVGPVAWGFTGEVTNAPAPIDPGPNYSDNRVLVGDHTNVFVGKVLRETGSKQLPGTYGSSFQYEVRVVLNIKGNLQGSVTVNQFMLGAPGQLQAGSTYVFASNYAKDANLYGVVYPFGYWLITNSHPGLVDLALALTNKRVRDLAAACPFQDTPPGRVRGGCNLFLGALWGAPVITIFVALMILCFVWWRGRKRIVGQTVG